MDWRYSFFTAEQGLLGIFPLTVALIVLALAASPGRRVIACAPCLFALAGFAACCLAAGLPHVENWTLVDYLPLFSLLLTLALFVPSTWALRRRWLGIVHALSLAGALLSFFVASMAISHDWL
ncbi:hypothetical protein [Xanthomonas sp. NCPPB 1128]|uniref:hypothetical protein n=1 Tax=Xanthomonas sp. NCPPB 1128 TaxID=1775876 RepID=UPI00103F4F9C|nr:hypothetical protein [Xanthomonas sp. NCPPB 1128]